MKSVSRLIALVLLTTACQPMAAPPPARMPQSTIAPTAPPTTTGKILELSGFLQRTHDPVMAKDGDTYYVFSSGANIPFLVSKDMLNWEFGGRVFKATPIWVKDAVPNVMDLWAPDISFFNGKWHLYYAGSTLGSRNSVIGLATNATLDPTSPKYMWVDEGLVIKSDESKLWNAIDANLVLDADGTPWLTFGSYWGGIKLQKLDAATGKLASPDTPLLSLARRAGAGTDAIEGAFVFRRDKYFYLFVSFDFCCRGVESTYNIRVGRSENVTGSYVDRDGKPMMDGGGTLVLSGSKRWRGPGHNGIYVEGDTAWLVYHAYDADQIGISKLRIESLAWDADGWPTAPSQAEAAGK
jgi:arabinan endo-1,5-alpha-L-arabinosidase